MIEKKQNEIIKIPPPPYLMRLPIFQSIGDPMAILYSSSFGDLAQNEANSIGALRFAWDFFFSGAMWVHLGDGYYCVVKYMYMSVVVGMLSILIVSAVV